MGYVRLIKLPTSKSQITQDFVDVANEMAYDDPTMIIDEIQPKASEVMYLPLEKEEAQSKPQGTTETVTMLGLVGGRWYPCEVDAIRDAKGVLWITSEQATEF